MLQGGASGEALLTHLLSDISPPADALKVSETWAPVPGSCACFLTYCPDFLFACTYDCVSFYHKLCNTRGSTDGGLQSGKPSAPKKLKLDMGEALAPPSQRKGDRNANSDVCAAALRGGLTGLMSQSAEESSVSRQPCGLERSSALLLDWGSGNFSSSSKISV